MANDFRLTIDDFSVPASPDPNKCRVYGFLVDVTGIRLQNSQVLIRNRFIPQIVSDPAVDLAVLGNDVRVLSDNTGFIQFDLYRNAQVEMHVPSQSLVPHSTLSATLAADQFYAVTIPDQASMNLVDLLYPVPDSLEFVNASPVIIAVDAQETIDLILTLTNGLVAADVNQVKFISSDETKVVFAKGTNAITLNRLAAGPVFITAEIDLAATLIRHQPPRILKLVVNSVEDPSGYEVN